LWTLDTSTRSNAHTLRRRWFRPPTCTNPTKCFVLIFMGLCLALCLCFCFCVSFWFVVSFIAYLFVYGNSLIVGCVSFAFLQWWVRCTSSPVCCFKPKPISEPQNILFYTSPYFTSWQGTVGGQKFSPFGPEFPVGPDSPPSQARVSAPSRVSLICMGRARVFFKNSPSAPDPILHSDTPSRCRRHLGLPLLHPRFPTAVLRLAWWFSHPGTSPPRRFTNVVR